MTTIAVDHRTGVAASDSKCTIGAIWVTATKVYRHKDELIGIAGADAQGQRWFDWYKAGKKGTLPKFDQAEALILRKDGLYYVEDGGTEYRIERGFHAIGSGGAAAMAVMLAGHSAEEAVRIAIQVDAQSGGEVQVFNLREPST